MRIGSESVYKKNYLDAQNRPWNANFRGQKQKAEDKSKTKGKDHKKALTTAEMEARNKKIILASIVVLGVVCVVIMYMVKRWMDHNKEVLAKKTASLKADSQTLIFSDRQDALSFQGEVCTKLNADFERAFNEFNQQIISLTPRMGTIASIIDSKSGWTNRMLKDMIDSDMCQNQSAIDNAVNNGRRPYEYVVSPVRKLTQMYTDAVVQADAITKSTKPNCEIVFTQ